MIRFFVYTAVGVVAGAIATLATTFMVLAGLLWEALKDWNFDD